MASHDGVPDQTPPHESGGSGLPAISPDFVEQEDQELIDNLVPTRGYDMLPMVGLGGSAGSIDALQRFFTAMPAQSGMAFVVIMHLSPQRESIMAELLGRCTTMRVVQAKNGQKVKANTVYVIPPGKFLAAVRGHLRLTDLEPEKGTRVAVDLFFRSLADTHGPRAAAIVLSGADGDGALGIKRIKERGGLTIAQDPEEAEHHSMPQSAIATGMVDWVLKVAEMPRRLVEYQASEQRLRVPPEEGPQPALAAKLTADEAETALREVLAFLRKRTGRDFSYYKRATIVRRISRRMQINSVDDVPTYLIFLRTHAGEAGALLQDLLISVTNFFRDRDCFGALELLIPELFKAKGPDDCVRVWVPACATGEEAYSIAMLLLEHAQTLDPAPGLQIFACDLDEDAIQVGRAGIYPAAITADVSEERLRRFFTRETQGYRVRRELRELVLFAAHDLLKDAPFSRMDLISCRNLLIYLNADAQKRALEIFHFGLGPRGLMFLGSSESVDEESPLFKMIDKKHRIYTHSPAQRIGLQIPVAASALTRVLAAQQKARGGPVLPGQSFAQTGALQLMAKAGNGLEHLSLAELHFRLVERFAPPSVIVNAEHEIVHLSENAWRFLQLAGGEPTFSILRSVHPMLQMTLRAALFQAAESGKQVEVPQVPLEMDGMRRAVNISVAPAGDMAPGFLLVVFEPSGARSAAAGESTEPLTEPDPGLRQMERELDVVKGRLRETVEQYEASTEELRASNEELQAMNEELHSAFEELETSREELQSINEELNTVNQELKSKVQELGRANSDLHNLMASTAIATIFLDREFRIMRYTPSAVGLFRIIPGDIGRPLADLRHQLDYAELQADVERVLDSLVAVERETAARDDRWFLARLLPYRTLEDQIAGVVLTFVDITERKRAEEAKTFLAAIVESSEDSVISVDFNGGITSWNRAAERVYGYPAAEALGKPLTMLTLPEDLAEVLRNAERIKHSQAVESFDSVRVHKDGHEMWLSLALSPVRNKEGKVIGISTIARDTTECRNAVEALQAAQRRIISILESTTDCFYSLDAEWRFTYVNPRAEAYFRTSSETMLGRTYMDAFPSSQGHEIFARQQTAMAERRPVQFETCSPVTGNSVELHVMPNEDGLAVFFRDITDRARRGGVAGE